MLSGKQEAVLGILNELWGRSDRPVGPVSESSAGKLVAQACPMPDDETTTSLHEQIRIFIREKQEAM
jgi:hypothetical protein